MMILVVGCQRRSVILRCLQGVVDTSKILDALAAPTQEISITMTPPPDLTLLTISWQLDRFDSFFDQRGHLPSMCRVCRCTSCTTTLEQPLYVQRMLYPQVRLRLLFHVLMVLSFGLELPQYFAWVTTDVDIHIHTKKTPRVTRVDAGQRKYPWR